MTEASTPTSAAIPGSLRLGQVATVLLLFGGYASLYFCRADLAVATPLMLAEMARDGIPHDVAIVRIGTITSLGVLAYALGNLFLGGLGDFWGGRPSFLVGLTGATVFTCVFAAVSGTPLMTVAWVGSQLTQSLAWAGLLKVSSRWFDYTSHGTVIGILSMSYLMGDAAARDSMGILIQHGVGWRGLFVFAACVSGALLLANALLLRESRTLTGHAPARPNPLNVYADSQGQQGLSTLLLPLLRSRAFILVCVLSFACTIVRQTFNVWTPAYLRDYLGYDPAGAASASAVFPAVGAISVLLMGWASDRLGSRGRTLLLALGLVAATGALLLVRMLPAGASGSLLPLLAIGAVAFCLLGPYSCLGGALALDFGGARGGAIVAGIIDAVGYFGGALAGDGVARISVVFGWQGVFLALAATSAFAALAAAWLHALRRPS